MAQKKPRKKNKKRRKTNVTRGAAIVVPKTARMNPHTIATARNTPAADANGSGVIMQAEAYAGPVVHHSIAAGWEAVVPGSAERILAMAERQGRHRQFIEKVAVIARSFSQIIGPVFGTALGAYGMYLGFQLVMAGKDLTGMTAFVSGLGSLVWAYYRATSQKRAQQDK